MDYLRSTTNSLLVEDLQEYEHAEAARLEGITHAYDRARDDPNDVFFAARDRREEIKEEIEALQEALTRDPHRQRNPKARSVKWRPKNRKKRPVVPQLKCHMSYLD